MKKFLSISLILIAQLIMLGHNVIPHHHHHHHGDQTHGNIPHHKHNRNDDGQSYHTFSEFIATSLIQTIGIIEFDGSLESDVNGDFLKHLSFINIYTNDNMVDYVQPPPDVGHNKSRLKFGAQSHRGPPIFS